MKYLHYSAPGISHPKSFDFSQQRNDIGGHTRTRVTDIVSVPKLQAVQWSDAQNATRWSQPDTRANKMAVEPGNIIITGIVILSKNVLLIRLEIPHGRLLVEPVNRTQRQVGVGNCRLFVLNTQCIQVLQSVQLFNPALIWLTGSWTPFNQHPVAAGGIRWQGLRTQPSH